MKYDDIISLSRPISSHNKMNLCERAAQFSPFAALTGYEDDIEEASRITFDRIHLSDSAKDIINEKLNYINNHIKSGIVVSIIYFKNDFTKDGGTYLTKKGVIKRIDSVYKTIKFDDNTIIDLNDITDILIDI